MISLSGLFKKFPINKYITTETRFTCSRNLLLAVGHDLVAIFIFLAHLAHMLLSGSSCGGGSNGFGSSLCISVAWPLPAPCLLARPRLFFISLYGFEFLFRVLLGQPKGLLLHFFFWQGSSTSCELCFCFVGNWLGVF